MYTVAAPPAEWAPWIECLWELHAATSRSWQETVPADLSTDLVLSLGQSYLRVGSSAPIELSGLHYLGIRAEPERFVHSGANHLLGIRFKPGFASRFLSWRGSDLVGQLEAADAPLRSLHDATSRLVAQLQSIHSPEPLLRSSEVRRAVFGYLDAVRSSSSFASCVPQALQVIREQRCFRVASIARAVGVTERSLERHFRDALGVRPKFAARVIRVQLARSGLELGHPAASVAHGLGFSDQSHLCFEMRSLLGVTASENTFVPPVCRISPSPAAQ